MGPKSPVSGKDGKAAPSLSTSSTRDGGRFKKISSGPVASRLTTGPTARPVLRGILERVRGIEPLYEAWEAAVLPLNYTRIATRILTLARPAGVASTAAGACRQA